MRPVERVGVTRGLVIWSVVVAAVCLLVTIGPAVALRPDSNEADRAGAALITVLLLNYIFLAPALLAGVWLGGYGFWRGKVLEEGKKPAWSVGHVMVYLGIAVIAIYVLTLCAWRALLGF